LDRVVVDPHAEIGKRLPERRHAPSILRLARRAMSSETSGGRYKLRMMSEFAPTLRVDENAGRVRLGLDGFFSAEGQTLQEAADELVRKMLVLVMAFRAAGISGFGVACRPDREVMVYLWELGEIAAAGGDIRERLFGPSSMAA